ncbi:triose phosphate transporter [Coprinopsis cinerea okayama7|uniref:Triose phosphate transporter n=1 Tax=Coprinopsis cinerea (strain Okayama-7 / 130 / ATCC MYA-4618 / FGSC 9003) TaxID=240176 RepID=A8N6E0_COPC7|nr:triose phosphate transporter [Coprinopsis cinerea okayama7\|eukprot:XP_001830409.2 triose phosphate transporter [Coprinopsis cinerea okayama7\
MIDGQRTRRSRCLFVTLKHQDADDTLRPLSARSEGLHLASLAEKKRLWWRNAIINLLFIASWFFFATLLSVYNKWMFSPQYYGFPAPLFVTTMHMFVQFALASFLRFTWPQHFRPKSDPKPRDYGTKVVPTSIATGLDIGFSNLSLKTITLSFYTMCKSSSLIFVLFFAFLFRLERFTWTLIGVIALIFAGVILMVATETSFVLEGFLLVMSASALGGLRWSLTQVLLKDKKMGMDNPAATIFWLAPCMGITLAIVSAAIESWGTLFSTKFFQGLGQIAWTTGCLTAPGVIAFCMVLSEFYIIHRTGILPMSIAGIAKEVSTITLSAWFFGDKLTVLNMTGVGITVCGIGLFTYHKYRKSMESTVPLDAHGNPVSESDEYLEGGDAEETAHLTEFPRSEEDDEDGSMSAERSRPSLSSGHENRAIAL